LKNKKYEHFAHAIKIAIEYCRTYVDFYECVAPAWKPMLMGHAD
jgi:hypothetical protein